MCRECWFIDGEPTLLVPESERVIQLAQQIYTSPKGSTGGNLHVMLDDWNLEDESIVWCLELPELTPQERECAELLRGMSYEERSATLARWQGFTRV